MDNQNDPFSNPLHDKFDGLVEMSDELVKKAVMGHKKLEKIKNMPMPTLWTQDEFYEKKVVYTGMRQRQLLNSYREVRIKLLKKSQTDNMVVLVSSVTGSGP